MKMRKKIILTMVSISVLAGFAFADTTPTYSTWNVNPTVNGDNLKFKQVVAQLRELRKEFIDTKDPQQKLVIKQKIVQLLQTYYVKYPILMGRYIHADFHLTEKELKQNLKPFKQQEKQQLKQELTWAREQLKEAWKTNMKGLKRWLDKDIKDQIKAIWKKYQDQIHQLRSSLKGLSKEQRKDVIQQIRELRIKRLEEIASLVPVDKKQKIENYINQLKQHFITVDSDYQTYKNSIQQKKTEIYTQISTKVKGIIDNAINKFEDKLKNLPEKEQQKIVDKVLKKINKIIVAHENSKQNHNSLHFKTEIWILTYLQEKVEEIKQDLNLQSQEIQDNNIINQVLNNVSK